MKLYTLNYVLRFHNDASNTDSLVTYSVHGVVGIEMTPKSIHVTFDDSSPMAGMQWDVEGELVRAEMVEEL